MNSPSSLAERIAVLKRHSRPLSRVATAQIDLNDVEVPGGSYAGPPEAGLLLYPLVAAVRAATKARVSRRLPSGATARGVLAVYAAADQQRLNSWPSHVERTTDGRLVLTMPKSHEQVDLTGCQFEQLADGVCWVDVRRDGERVLTLGIYAPQDRLDEIFGTAVAGN